MSHFLRVLQDMQILRTALSELSFEQVKKIHARFALVYLERLKHDDEELKRLTEHDNKLATPNTISTTVLLAPTDKD
ncbi:H-NS family histone-like protein [Aeromonas rivipollensis]|uniref:DNA-binding protein H-NS-like N-terminal domain-containing protein n=1 Tax=Aeromonas rivipollensis TaxID=948519 RepID=A0AAW9Y695_9GAMM|nr:hypothetical protein [Aeromonas rivipollensis]NEX73593.1 hypothetical protein [Aeromonas rivipollensis]